MSIAGQPRPEAISQKIKTLNGILPGSIIILAIDNLRFLRMQFQSTFLQASSYCPFQAERFVYGTTVDDSIIGVSLKGDARVISIHPVIKRIVQEQIGQQRTDNDRFPRSIYTPVISSRHLYTGRRMIGNRFAFMLIPGMSKLPGFDDNSRFFDTSSMVRLRSPPDHTPDIYKMPSLHRSLPEIFTPAA